MSKFKKKPIKEYVDNLVYAGFKVKDPVKAASIANINTALALNALDGYTLAVSDRVLLRNQTTVTQNGVYQLNASKIPIKVDADSGIGNSVFVEYGSTQNDYIYVSSIVNAWSVFSKPDTIDKDPRFCKVCGCSSDHACPGGCHWVTDDLCSNCVFSIFTCEATVSPNESLEPIDGTSDYLADEIVSEEICEGYVAGHAAALGLSSEAEDTALHIGDRVMFYAIYQHSEIIKQIVYVLEPKKE